MTPDDLHHHVLLYLEHPRAAWLDWELWFHALGLRDFEPAGKLHFSHYDQLIQAALDGHGVALGRHPLLRQLLRERKLVAPFKNKVASSRAYYVVESTAAKVETASARVRRLARRGNARGDARRADRRNGVTTLRAADALEGSVGQEIDAKQLAVLERAATRRTALGRAHRSSARRACCRSATTLPVCDRARTGTSSDGAALRLAATAR